MKTVLQGNSERARAAGGCQSSPAPLPTLPKKSVETCHLLRHEIDRVGLEAVVGLGPHEDFRPAPDLGCGPPLTHLGTGSRERITLGAPLPCCPQAHSFMAQAGPRGDVGKRDELLVDALYRGLRQHASDARRRPAALRARGTQRTRGDTRRRASNDPRSLGATCRAGQPPNSTEESRLAP